MISRSVFLGISGFTLIEVLVVVFIVGVLTSLFLAGCWAIRFRGRSKRNCESFMHLGLGKSLQTHPGLKAKILREPLRPYGAGLGQHDCFIGVQNYKKNRPLDYFFLARTTPRISDGERSCRR